MANPQTQPILDKLYEALEEIKWKMADSPERLKAFEKVKEAILWVEAQDIFKERKL